MKHARKVTAFTILAVGLGILALVFAVRNSAAGVIVCSLAARQAMVDRKRAMTGRQREARPQ